jgi:hypothetical protein
MSTTKNVVAIAREVIARHGSNAVSMMHRRVYENARAGDGEAAALWMQVGKAVRALEPKREIDGVGS